MTAAVPVSKRLGKGGFDLEAARVASRPPEARGLTRDGVRLLVAGGSAVEHATVRDLPRYLEPGDLVVVNTSATLPAAVDGVRSHGEAVTVHFSTALDEGEWAVDVRPAGRALGPISDPRVGERLELPGGASLRLEGRYPDPDSIRSRLWRVTVASLTSVPALLARHGRPIAYAYVEGRWPLEAYQTIFAREPGSAEMPSAGRPFTRELVYALEAAGIGFASLVLHTGVSSLEPGELPYPERFRVPARTAEQVNATRAAGGRIVAVGTTVTRALESVADRSGTVRAGRGWTDLVLSADRPARAVDAIITGWHGPGTSHLALLEAVAGEDLVWRAYHQALAGDYLWHEFGDSALLIGARASRTRPR